GLRNAKDTQTLDLADIYGSPSSSQNPKTFQPKNNGLVVETFDWDEEEVFDDEEVTQVKVLMALADDELTVCKSHARNGYGQEMVPKTKDWVERLNPDSKLPNFNIGRILVPESQVVNESLEYIKNLFTPESSKYSEAKSLTPLPPFKNIQGASPSLEILKAKAKLFPPCTYCGFNDYRPGDCRNYPECGICRSYDHFTSGHNRVIHIKGAMLAESSQSSESSIGVKCNTCRSTVHSTTNHNDFDHFKRGEKIQVIKAREPTKK
nr:hypothetical protein [Tanacetum cinerariifolium]